jgi:hypothetical protein
VAAAVLLDLDDEESIGDDSEGEKEVADAKWC